jgi:hypothetical protein
VLSIAVLLLSIAVLLLSIAVLLLSIAVLLLSIAVLLLNEVVLESGGWKLAGSLKNRWRNIPARIRARAPLLRK